MLGTTYFPKIVQIKKQQFVLIAKISSRKTQKNRQSAKIDSRKNFVPHGMLTNAVIHNFSPLLLLCYLIMFIKLKLTLLVIEYGKRPYSDNSTLINT